MLRKKVDSRVKTLIENSIKKNHRSFFVIVGDKGKDQVVKLHYILSKSSVRAQPTVLWCYKTDLGFSTHRKKRIKRINKKKKQGIIDPDTDDPFELFMTTANIRFTFYKDTHKILGNTFGMCILQDFEAITPNILARTVETVEGGGLIVLLLKTMNSLRQLYTMAMDIHNRFRTDSHQEVVPRFNERFLLSLVSCENSLIMDDELNILPVSLASRKIVAEPTKTSVDEQNKELRELKESLSDTEIVGVLVEKTKTLDQARAVVTFIEAISEKTLRSTVALTAARGRGKSAALGLSIAAAVAFGYSNIFVSSPDPENLKTLFQFIFQGFDALGYLEHTDYEIIQSTNPEFKKAVVRINIFRTHRQVVQYIIPTDAGKLGQAELVVIDEAAAIPLPHVKALLGPYLAFMSSTINGYEGTGRSLSLKLIKELKSGASGNNSSVGGRVFREVTLEDSIRYASHDPVEKWLNGLLCLDATEAKPISIGCPHPSKCELYYVNRDTLFSYHKVSEEFLQRMMALYVSSHYKNSPNDLILMSDAPAHHLFVLLPPIDENTTSLPEVLCVLQVSLEGEIGKESIENSFTQGKRPAGDLIPWNISMQFQDDNFPTLSGVRVVRIATHPDFMRAGYGTRALELLQAYYEGKMTNLDEDPKPKEQQVDVLPNQEDIHSEQLLPRKHLPPLLNKLSERPPEHLHWVGVSYGLTMSLFYFWKKNGFLPVYLRLTELSSTGEHTCIMLKSINGSEVSLNSDWLTQFYDDFTQRFVSLMGYDFRKINCKDALSIISKQRDIQQTFDGRPKIFFGKRNPEAFGKTDLDKLFSVHDIKRLESYVKNLLDYHALLDLLPQIARLFFIGIIFDVIVLSPAQYCILAGLGLQFKNIDTIAHELNLQPNQVLALLKKTIRKIVNFFLALEEAAEEKLFPESDPKKIDMNPAMSLAEDMAKINKETKKMMEEKQKNLLSQFASPDYAIQGDEKDWEDAALKLMHSKVPNIISVKRKLKGAEEPTTNENFQKQPPKKKRKTSGGKKRKSK